MSLDNTPTPKSKLTPSKSKSLDEILEAVINGNGPRPRFDPQMTIAEAKTAILSLFRELVPEEAIQLGCEENEAHAWNCGWDACREQMLKRLEGL